ncbi:hypothetical protein HQ563_06650 [bacterium]|nr:hypothetical protein [bacterium]
MDNDTKGKGSFLNDYLRMFAKHKFLIIIPLVVVFLGSTIVGSTLPNVYTARAVFRMLSRSSPAGRSGGRSIADNLDVMRQLILRRSNLAVIAKEVGLDSSYANLPEAVREAREGELVKHLQKDLEVRQKATHVYEVSYRSEDPDIAARLANAVMTRYIDQVVKDEKAEMASTVDFVERRVKEYQSKVRASSEALRKFKTEHILDMPGSDLSVSRELRNLRDQLAAVETELGDAETAKTEIEKQMLSVDATEIGETVVETNPLIRQYRAQLDRLELELATLKSRRTDIHPDVVKKKSEIKIVKTLIEKAPEKSTTKETRQSNPLYVKLTQDLKDSEVRIATAKKRKERLLANKAESENRLKNAPALEKQMAELTENDTLHRRLLANYVAELENAKIAQEREREQKGTRFDVLDYAKKPSSPDKSNKLKVAMMGLLLGGGLGLGLAVLKDQTDTSFKDVRDAASFLGIPIVGTIPVINTPAERAREKKKESLAWIIVGTLLVLLVAALIVTSLTSFPGR